MRSLDFTACIREDCPINCGRKLTEEEKEWLSKNPNRMSYSYFEHCDPKAYFEEKKDDTTTII